MYCIIITNKNQEQEPKEKNIGYNYLEKLSSCKVKEVKKMLNETTIEKIKMQKDSALDGITFVLNCPDKDLLWYIAEFFLGAQMHPGTDEEKVREIVEEIRDELSKNLKSSNEA